MRSKKKKKRCNLTIFGKVIVIFFFLLTTFFVFKSIPKQEIKENKSIKKVLKKKLKGNESFLAYGRRCPYS